MEKHLAGRSPYTINERTGRIKTIWKFAARKGFVSIWPTLDGVPEPPPFKRAWHADQLRALVAACKNQKGRIGCIPADRFGSRWCSSCGTPGSELVHFPFEVGVAYAAWPGCSRGRSQGTKGCLLRLSDRTRELLESIRAPQREFIFEFPFHLSTLYNRYKANPEASRTSDRPQEQVPTHQAITFDVLGHRRERRNRTC